MKGGKEQYSKPLLNQRYESDIQLGYNIYKYIEMISDKESKIFCTNLILPYTFMYNTLTLEFNNLLKHFCHRVKGDKSADLFWLIKY